tara:strand:- start:34542 stop:34763 length:222 start_codon:yes stop_codon:yes gene_type:complete
MTTLTTSQIANRIIRSGNRNTRFEEAPDVFSDGTPKITINKETGEKRQRIRRRHYPTLASVFIEAAKDWKNAN